MRSKSKMSAINKSLNNSKQNCSNNGSGNTSSANISNNDILTSSHVSSLQSLSSAKSNSTNAPECYGCHKIIKERYLLKALDHLWHEDCLKCVCCDCRLGEVGSTLFTKADLILCKRDYLRFDSLF
jgi:hypothetical protein